MGGMLVWAIVGMQASVYEHNLDLLGAQDGTNEGAEVNERWHFFDTVVDLAAALPLELPLHHNAAGPEAVVLSNLDPDPLPGLQLSSAQCSTAPSHSRQLGTGSANYDGSENGIDLCLPKNEPELTPNAHLPSK